MQEPARFSYFPINTHLFKPQAIVAGFGTGFAEQAGCAEGTHPSGARHMAPVGLLAPQMTAWMSSSSESGKPEPKLRLTPTSSLPFCARPSTVALLYGF